MVQLPPLFGEAELLTKVQQAPPPQPGGQPNRISKESTSIDRLIFSWCLFLKDSSYPSGFNRQQLLLINFNKRECKDISGLYHEFRD
jgi:hypothetical protein